jgi:hypothetical protein
MAFLQRSQCSIRIGAAGIRLQRVACRLREGLDGIGHQHLRWSIR